MVERFFENGWAVFEAEKAVSEWVQHARLDAVRALRDPALDHWYQCDRTWFVGLDALSNDAAGRVGDSAPLTGRAVSFVHQMCSGWPELHPAQISGVFPGYPRPRDGESEAAFRYRLNRDAAHVDGVLGLGHPKRRFVKEPHASILGFPLTEADPDAAPLVVWEGSHEVMRKAFAAAFAQAGDTPLDEVDVTDAYVAARRDVFETCPRRIVHAPPGSAYLVHRLTLHGVGPWKARARAAPEGRLIAYFRPPLAGGAGRWIDLP